jgi:hypothetical protein
MEVQFRHKELRAQIEEIKVPLFQTTLNAKESL